MHYTLNDPRQYLAATKTIEAAREREVKLTVKIAETDQYTALQAIVNIAADAHMEISITSHRQPRTIPQNSYLHFLCQYFATEYGCTTAEAKEVYLKRHAAPEIFAEIVTNRHGQRVTRYRSTASLSTQETSSAIHNFIAWAAMGGIELPLPEDKEFVFHAQKEIERNQSYI